LTLIKLLSHDTVTWIFVAPNSKHKLHVKKLEKHHIHINASLVKLTWFKLRMTESDSAVWSRSRASRFRAAQFRAAQYRAERFSAAGTARRR